MIAQSDLKQGEGDVTYDYIAYGLNFRSDIPLPELSRGYFAQVDVVVRCRDVARAMAEPGTRIVEFDDEEAYFALGGLAKFLVAGVDRIDYEPLPGTDITLLNLAILGPVMAILLHRRGMLILHGSAITVDGKAAIFLGDKGAGKSTTAGAMVAAGYSMLTDDVLAIDLTDARAPTVVPGYPQIKLDIVAADLFDLPDHEIIPTNAQVFLKKRIRFPENFTQTATPLGGVYLLSRGENAEAARLGPAEALRGLMRFSYIVRFGEEALPHGGLSRHLMQCAAVANVVGVYDLEVPSGLTRIDEAIALVEAHLGRTQE